MTLSQGSVLARANVTGLPPRQRETRDGHARGHLCTPLPTRSERMRVYPRAGLKVHERGLDTAACIVQTIYYVHGGMHVCVGGAFVRAFSLYTR